MNAPHLLSRRQFLEALAAATALSLAPRPVVGATEGTEPLRIGYIPITDAAPLLVAHALGYFQEEGLTVHPPLRVRSWSTLAESFLSGKFNLTHLLFPMTIWMRYKLGADVKVLAWDHTNGSAITVRRDSHIRGFEDLGGCTIAVPYWYSIHNILLQMGLKVKGLTPVIHKPSGGIGKNRVNLLILPPPEMPAALAAHKIDGYIVAEPYNAIGEVKLNARIMRFTGDLWRNHPCCVVAMQGDLVKRRPVFTQKVLNAVVRAQHWLMNNRSAAGTLLSRQDKNLIPVSDAVLNRVFTYYDKKTYGGGAVRHPDWNLHRIDFQPFPYPSATRFLFQALRQTRVEGDAGFLNQLTADFIHRDLVADRFVKKAMAGIGGFGPQNTADTGPLWEREEIFEL